jgi:glucokinase
MSRFLVAMDVGATNTRIAIGEAGQPFGPELTRVRQPVGSARALREFLRDTTAHVIGSGRVTLVAGFAGVPEPGGLVTMTNWGGDRDVTHQDLLNSGFDQVRMLNDLEAAGHGLIALLGDQAEDTGAIVPLSGRWVPDCGNRALVMPGTGLGSVGIVDLGGGERWHVVPSETQHGLATGESKREMAWLDRVRTELGRPPTWEDCVSGRGLERLYHLAISGAEAGPLDAGSVAKLALEGDERATAALTAFYSFVGGFSQQLALAFLSTGGLFLSGSSTRKNLEFIPKSPFLEAFKKNDLIRHVIETLPVFVVTQELNLRGAWSVGSADRRR